MTERERESLGMTAVCTIVIVILADILCNLIHQDIYPLFGAEGCLMMW